MAEPEYPVLRELETKLKLQWIDTDDYLATQRAIIQVEPEAAYLELPRGRKGDKGDPGPAISIQGIVAADSQLPANAEIGHAYVNTSTKGLAVWNGSQWFKVDNFAGVDADVQQFSRWFAQIESDARRAVDAAERAEFAAEETIQQVEGDFATKNYVDTANSYKAEKSELATVTNRVDRISPRLTEMLGATSWAHATKDGHRLPLGYTGEGRLDAYAVTAWQEQVGNLWPSAPGEYIHAAVSETGHLIWGVKPDGTVVIPGLDGGRHAAKREKYRMDDGTLANVYADNSTFVGWGSSSLSMMKDQFTSLLGAKEIAYMGRGRGGERIEHIAARMGAVPSMINPVTIPASGRVAVSSENVRTQRLFLPYDGTLAGVHGTLSVENNQMYFTRSNSGSVTTLSESAPFIPDDNNLRGKTVIISAGKNDLGETGAIEHVLEYTDEMVKHLTPLFPRVLVMGHFMDQDTPIGGLEYRQILEVNAELERRYGDYFYDHLAAFAGEEIWERTGITPTAQDLQQQQDLRLPPSLAGDNAHATRTANNALVPMIGDHMARLGWI